jgi:hypothetical protein
MFYLIKTPFTILTKSVICFYPTWLNIITHFDQSGQFFGQSRLDIQVNK